MVHILEKRIFEKVLSMQLHTVQCYERHLEGFECFLSHLFNHTGGWYQIMYIISISILELELHHNVCLNLSRQSL